MKRFTRFFNYLKFGSGGVKSLLALIAFLSYVNIASAQFQQRIYATVSGPSDVENSDGSISGQGNAVDGNIATASTLSVGLGLLDLFWSQQNVRFASQVSGSTPVTLKLGSGGSFLDLLGGTTIQATLNGSPVGPSFRGTALLNLLGGGVLSGGANVYEATFTPGVTYDGVRVRVSSTLGLGITANFYHAYYLSPTSTPNCNTPVDALYGVGASSLSLASGVSNPYNVLTGATPATQLNTGITATGNVSETVVFPGSRVGNAQVVISRAGSPLVNASVLSNIRIIVSDRGIQRSSTALNTLLTVNLLSSFNNPTAQQVTLTIPQTSTWDRITILTSGTVNALTGLNIHRVTRLLPAPTVTSTNVSIYAGQTATLTATSVNNTDVLTWFNSANQEIGTGTSINVTPSITSSYTVVAKSGESCNDNSAPATATVTVFPLPTFTNPTLAVVGTNYTATGTDHKIVVSNGQAGSTYKFSNSTGLPPGLTLNEDGFLIGTPTGTYPTGGTLVTFKADVTDITLSKAVAVQRDFTVRVYPRLAANTTALASGTPGTAYNQPIPAPTGGSGVTANYTYAVTEGALPPGLSVVNGAITGTPTTAGVYNFSVTVTDPVTQTSAVQTYTLVVGAPLVANNGTLPNSFVGATPYPASQIPAPTGGTGTGYTYAVTSGTTPPGLTVNANGTITGSPTTAGSYTFTVTVTDIGSGLTVAQPYTVVISGALVANAGTLPNSFVGASPYPATSVPVPTGGSGATNNYTYAASGTTPPGLTFNSNGSISGSPTTAGTYNFSVTVTDPGSGSSVVQPYTVVISPALVANVTDLPDSYVGISPYPASSIPAPTGGSGATGDYTYAVTGTTPPGLVINSDGTITGTPTTAGTYTFTVTVTDPASGSSVAQPYTVVIGPALVANTTDLPDSYVGATTYATAVPIPTGGSGVVANYTYNIGGVVPPGLTIGGNGTITGLPTTAGTYSFTVTVTDPASGLSVVQSYSVVISPQLTLPGGTFPTAYVNQPSYSEPISEAIIDNVSGDGSAVGGRVGATLTYSLNPPTVGNRILAFPSGFSLSAQGVLSGVPATQGLSTNDFTVYVTDGEQIASATYTLVIESALPVKLASFKVSKEGEVAQLSWSTTSESNSESFEVQRSRDGKEWKAIGSRDAKGESAAIVTYSFTDATPLDGENLYRLKMIDRDATFALSGIQSVRFAIESLKLYPNPVANAEPLTIQVKDWGLVKTVKVFNALGKVVFESAGDVKSVVSTEQLTAGLYVVQVTRKDGQVVSSKFVKR